MEKHALLISLISIIIFSLLFIKLYKWSKKDKGLLMIFLISVTLSVSGALLNPLVSVFNNGKMPVDINNISSRYNDSRYYKEILTPEVGDKDYVLAGRNTHLNFFGDRFLYFDGPRGVVGLASIGDVLGRESIFWLRYMFLFCVLWVFFIKPTILKLS